MLSFTFRTIKFSAESFGRNIWLSLVTIIILVLTLFLISLAMSLNIIATKAVQSVREKVDISVYFNPEAKESQVLATRDEVAEQREVREIIYVSSEEALNKFKEEHKNDSDIQESLKELEENPLGATLIVKAYRLEDYPKILSFLDKTTYAEFIQNKDFAETQSLIEKLSRITDRIQMVGLVVSLIFIFVASLVIFNTIRITIYTHRDEIGIMKLVGASNWFVRAPFIMESVFYALIATAITMALFYPLVSFASPYLSAFFEDYNFNLFNYFQENFLEVLFFQLIIALLLSVISSMVAITRYLKV